MTVTAAGPVNPYQLTGELEQATGNVGVLAVQGDPTAAGAVLWSSQWTDSEIEAALSAVTYEPPTATPVEQVAQLAASIPSHITQAQADAAAIAGITAGQALTADQVTALTNHANGWVTLLQALQTLVESMGYPTS